MIGELLMIAGIVGIWSAVMYATADWTKYRLVTSNVEHCYRIEVRILGAIWVHGGTYSGISEIEAKALFSAYVRNRQSKAPKAGKVIASA